MGNAVLMAKLEMAEELTLSLCEKNAKETGITDPQEMMDIAIVLSNIAGNAAIASGNLLNEIDCHYDHIERNEDPSFVDIPILPKWIQEAISEEAKKHGREPGAEALGILEDIFKDRKPEAAKQSA